MKLLPIKKAAEKVKRKLGGNDPDANEVVRLLNEQMHQQNEYAKKNKAKSNDNANSEESDKE